MTYRYELSYKFNSSILLWEILALDLQTKEIYRYHVASETRNEMIHFLFRIIAFETIHQGTLFIPPEKTDHCVFLYFNANYRLCPQLTKMLVNHLCSRSLEDLEIEQAPDLLKDL